MRSEKQSEPQTRYRVVTTLPWGLVEEIGSTLDLGQAISWAQRRHDADGSAAAVISGKTGRIIFSVGRGMGRGQAGGAA